MKLLKGHRQSLMGNAGRRIKLWQRGLGGILLREILLGVMLILELQHLLAPSILLLLFRRQSNSGLCPIAVRRIKNDAAVEASAAAAGGNNGFRD